MTTTDTARNQAINQMQYIEDLLGALNMDWDTYSELQDFLDHDDESELEEDDLAMLKELTEQAADCDNRDEALERLQQNPLDLQFRSDWESGTSDLTPHEFAILLCTGGPAVRIRGYLDNYGTPSNAWVEYQDWNTPWTELSTYQSTALEYAQLLIQEI